MQLHELACSSLRLHAVPFFRLSSSQELSQCLFSRDMSSLNLLLQRPAASLTLHLPNGPDCSTAVSMWLALMTDNWHCPLLRPDSPDSVSCVSGECLMGAAWLGGEQRSSDDIQTRSWPRPLIGHWVITLLSDWSEHLAYLVRDQPETGLVGPEWLCEWFERRVGGMDWYV